MFIGGHLQLGGRPNTLSSFEVDYVYQLLDHEVDGPGVICCSFHTTISL